MTAKESDVKLQGIETLTIFPSTLRHCRMLLVYLVGLVAMVVAAFYIAAHWNTSDAYATLMGVLAFLYGATVALPMITFRALSMLYRLLVRRPVLVATVDGIVDNGSLLACGVGLIRWEEIVAIAAVRYNPVTWVPTVRPWYLLIRVTDPAVLTSGRPGWLQFLRRVFARIMGSQDRLFVPQFMLDTSARGLIDPIRMRYEAREANRSLHRLPPITIAC